MFHNFTDLGSDKCTTGDERYRERRGEGRIQGRSNFNFDEVKRSQVDLDIEFIDVMTQLYLTLLCRDKYSEKRRLQCLSRRRSRC